MPNRPKTFSEVEKHSDNLQKVLAVTSKINSTLELDELLTIIMSTSAEVMSAEVASLLLLDEISQELIFRVALGAKGGELTEKFRVKVGEGIAGSVAKTGTSVIVNDTKKDERFAKRFDDNTGFSSQAILCVPMRARGKIIGVLEAINPLGRKTFSDNDLQFFEIFADQAAIAVENAKMHAEILKQEKAKQELKIASQIQMNFLPDLSNHAYGVDITAKTVPARTVGGDFYDVLNLSEDKVGIMISDVSGKGVPAALFMVSAISHFRFLAPHHPSPNELLTKLNQALARESTLGMFITCLYVILDKKERKMVCSSAGHHPILKRDHSGKTVELENAGGMPLGLDGEAEYLKSEITLHARDALFMYTDGIVEARNKKGEEYTLERLKECVHPGFTNAREYAGQIYKDLENFTQGANQHDDMTSLIITLP